MCSINASSGKRNLILKNSFKGNTSKIYFLGLGGQHLECYLVYYYSLCLSYFQISIHIEHLMSHVLKVFYLQLIFSFIINLNLQFSLEQRDDNSRKLLAESKSEKTVAESRVPYVSDLLWQSFQEKGE